jgi:hypothetical protein
MQEVIAIKLWVRVKFHILQKYHLVNYNIQNRVFTYQSNNSVKKKYHDILQYHDFISKL